MVRMPQILAELDVGPGFKSGEKDSGDKSGRADQPSSDDGDQRESLRICGMSASSRYSNFSPQ